jgi:hypothetical protein
MDGALRIPADGAVQSQLADRGRVVEWLRPELVGYDQDHESDR